MVIKIGIDTCCLDKLDQEPFNILKQYFIEGKVGLFSNTVLERDQENNKNRSWKAIHIKQINDLDKKLEVGRYDLSKYDESVYGNEESQIIFNSINSSNQKSEELDAWIASTYHVYGIEYFLTLNIKHFINLEKFGILVRQLDETFLKEIKEKIED